MVFKKGDKEIPMKGVEARKRNKEEREKLMVEFVTGKFDSYEKFMEQLRQGKEVGENERQFMDRLEKQFEFAFPKRNRVDKNGDDVDNTVEIVIKNEYAEFKPTVQGNN
jgi:hypothetical protein